MKTKMTGSVGIAMLLMVMTVLLVPIVAQAQETCTTNGTPNENDGTAGADTVTCNDPITANVDTLDDNDVVTVAGSSTGMDINTNAGNDTLINSGNHAGGSRVHTQTGNDLILNTGNFSGNSTLATGDGDNTLTSTGNFDSSQIRAGNNVDTFTIGGSFTNNSRIRLNDGNDTITLTLGTFFDATSRIDGGADTDVLIFQTTDAGTSGMLAAIDLTACQGGTLCTVTIGGSTFNFTNFEELRAILLQAEEFFGAALPAVPAVICEDGRVKVFKLPNGDVEYYSGFDIRPTNGFLVAKISLAEVVAGTRRFSDIGEANPDWYVVLTQAGDVFSGQVFDANGNPVGKTCRH